MSADKEGHAGEIKLYREHPDCFVVRVLETPDTDAMWCYRLKVLKVLDGSAEVGEEYEVSKSKEHGQMANWWLFDMSDRYAKEWLKGVDLSEFM